MPTPAPRIPRRVGGEERTFAEAIRRLSPYLEGVRWRWVAGLVSAMLAGFVALAIPQVIQRLVNSVLHPGGDAGGRLSELAPLINAERPEPFVL